VNDRGKTCAPDRGVTGMDALFQNGIGVPN
jgi:hypothetical protein